MWFTCFAVFRIHEYCFHAYILTIIVQSQLFILFSTKNSLIFIINSISRFKFSSEYFGQYKSKQNVLGSLTTITFSSMIIIT